MLMCVRYSQHVEYSQYVDADAEAGRDEHNGGVDLVVLAEHALNRHVDEDAGHDPDEQH